MEVEEADAAATKTRLGTVVVDDPDRKIEGELADDESNKRTGPKSRRKHRLGVRKEAGADVAEKQQELVISDDETIPVEVQQEMERECAAIRVQSVYRGHMERCAYFTMVGNELFEKEKRCDAAIAIQCAFRSFLARNEYYDILGGGVEDGARTPPQESALVPDAILKKYLRAVEENVLGVERTLREAMKSAKTGRQVEASGGSDPKLQMLLEENAELEQKLAEANDFLKGMATGGNSSLEVQTLKIQLELKDEELEELQQSLSEKSIELAHLEEVARTMGDLELATTLKEEMKLTQVIKGPIDSAQVCCQELEGTLGTLVEAVSSALNSRHEADMQVGNLQATALSLQNKNEVFFFENQGLRSKVEVLENEQHKTIYLIAFLSAEMEHTGKELAATRSAFHELETLKKEIEARHSVAEAHAKENNMIMEGVSAEKVSLLGKLEDAERQRQSQDTEAAHLRQQLATSQEALLATQTSLLDLQKHATQASSSRDSELSEMHNREQELQKMIHRLQTENTAVADTNTALTDQLQQIQSQFGNAEQRQAGLTEQVTDLQGKLGQSEELLASKNNEIEELKCESEGQDHIQGRHMDSILQQADALILAMRTLEVQERQQRHLRFSSLEHVQALIETLHEVLPNVSSMSEQMRLDVTSQARLEEDKAKLQSDLTFAQQSLATAKEELATLVRSVDDASGQHAVQQELEAEKQRALDQVQALQSALASSDEEVHGMKESLRTAQEATSRVQNEKQQLLDEMMQANALVTGLLSDIENGESKQARRNESLRVAVEGLLSERNYLAMQQKQQCNSSPPAEWQIEQKVIDDILVDVTRLEETVEYGARACQELLSKVASRAWLEEDKAKLQSDLTFAQQSLATTKEELATLVRSVDDASGQKAAQEELEAEKQRALEQMQALQSDKEALFRDLNEQLERARAEVLHAQEGAQEASRRLQDKQEQLQSLSLGNEAAQLDLETQTRMNERLESRISSNHETIRRLGLEVDKLKKQGAEHVAQLTSLEQERNILRDKLSDVLSHSVGIAAISAARLDLISEQAGGKENGGDRQVCDKDGDESLADTTGKEIEYCLAIEALYEQGLGLDVAVLKSWQTCGALVHRINALQTQQEVQEHEWQLALSEHKEQLRMSELKREEERKEERERAREQEQERERDKLEMKRVLAREQELERQWSSTEDVRDMKATTKKDDHDQQLVKHLQVVLEQKEKLLVSQSSTVTALETAVDALKGQVYSGRKLCH